MSDFQPAAEVQRMYVEMLRLDPALHALLFPVSKPALDATDYRIYGADVELAEDTEHRDQWPRVLVETMQLPFAVEQPGPLLQAEVSVYMHSMAERDDEELCERLDARVATILLSTQPPGVRIIAAVPSEAGSRRKGRISALSDNWEIVSQYRLPHVGVLV